jgi:hypothetical protein
MQLDRNFHDAAISIADIRHPVGRFGIELTIAGNPYTTRTAAKVDGHSHVIRAMALLTGLALLKTKKLSSYPRVLVTSDEEPFLRALRENRWERLVIPEEMKQRLQAELRAVNASFIHNVQPRFIISLENWLHAIPLDLLDELSGIMQQQSAA